MIIVRLLGGLGNQMFQYALGRAVQERTGFDLKFDLSSFESYNLRKYELAVFNIDPVFASNAEVLSLTKSKKSVVNKLLRFLGKKRTNKENFSLYVEKDFRFSPDVFDISDNTYIKGYFQSEKYFKDIAPLIRREFTFKEPPPQKCLPFLERISACNAVSLHIRRGDYVSHPIHGVDMSDYYSQAVRYIGQHVANPHFFIISDEPEWVKANFTIHFPMTVVDCNTADNGWDDMRLMMACQHNIIANSSFSWWGAWLNPNPNKLVTTPAQWNVPEERNAQQVDKVPQDWIKL